MNSGNGLGPWRPIYVRTWEDKNFLSLSQDARYLWFFLLTGPHITWLPGLIKTGPASMSEELDWGLEEIWDCMDEIKKRGMIYVDDVNRVIMIPNALKYNPPLTNAQIKFWRYNFNRIKDCKLKSDWLKMLFEQLGNYTPGVQKSIRKAFDDLPPFLSVEVNEGGEEGGNIREGEEGDDKGQRTKDKEEESRGAAPLAPALRIFNYWVELHVKNKKLVIMDTKRKAKIKQRLDEGGTEKELRSAIRGALLDDWLMGRTDRSTKKYNLLQTILRDRAQVERLMELDENERRKTEKTAQRQQKRDSRAPQNPVHLSEYLKKEGKERKDAN